MLSPRKRPSSLRDDNTGPNSYHRITRNKEPSSSYNTNTKGILC